jgi:hypothetical protein
VREILDMTRSFRSLLVLVGGSGAIDGLEPRGPSTAAMCRRSHIGHRRGRSRQSNEPTATSISAGARRPVCGSQVRQRSF